MTLKSSRLKVGEIDILTVDANDRLTSECSSVKLLLSSLTEYEFNYR